MFTRGNKICRHLTFSPQFPISEARARMKQEFIKHKNVTDVRVIDMLVVKGIKKPSCYICLLCPSQHNSSFIKLYLLWLFCICCVKLFKFCFFNFVSWSSSSFCFLFVSTNLSLIRSNATGGDSQHVGSVLHDPQLLWPHGFPKENSGKIQQQFPGQVLRVPRLKRSRK